MPTHAYAYLRRRRVVPKARNNLVILYTNYTRNQEFVNSSNHTVTNEHPTSLMAPTFSTRPTT
jgi:hypothetical protein